MKVLTLYNINRIGGIMSAKNNIELIKEKFKNEGCELLANEYINAFEKMSYICNCGNKSLISWNKFSQGRRCGYCGKRSKKYSLEEVKIIFQNKKLTMLQDFYIDHKTPIKYMCKCGNESFISLAQIQNLGQDNCIKCAGKKRSGSFNHMWIEDREIVKINLLFRKKCRNALYRTLRAIKQNKNNKTYKSLGYSSKDLYEHILKHPNWQTVKLSNWELDHIYPISAFIDYKIEDIKIINCLENLQPLSKSENCSKNDTYDKCKFEKWLQEKGLIND